MTPPVFVVDTNVVVAGLVTGASDSPVAAVLDAMLAGSLIFLLSSALLDEYRSVLLRPKLARLHRLSEVQLDQLLVELTTNAIWRDADLEIPAPDRGDDHLWALLSAYPGSILITGDRLLLQNPPMRNAVISPGSWLQDY